MSLIPGIPRPRRLRRNATLRRMTRETQLRVDDLVQPLFVVEGSDRAQAIGSLPGQFRRNIDDLCREGERLFALGIPAVALFPSLPPERKDAEGSEALRKETLVLRAVRALKGAVPELQVMTDIALDPYTTHGHDGVLTAAGDDVDNDRTVEILRRMACLHAEAGTDMVAPSDMMDGRVGAIREALDENSFSGTAILAYSAKFDSAFYGPFREAVGSAQAAGTPLLGKAGYQLNPANAREAERELELDEAEGADMLMVKPAGPYLDIVRLARERSLLPVAAYQVSGEYAQIHAAAEKGWLDLVRCRDESLLAIRRAGAELILTYFAGDWARDQKRL
ncbi:MAG: porphobilinogen synthase [Verrucomicrobia bacterium]|jgi:porphobilinogen synthase|nr:porphobilinogen synthase [Verrucomicrobiota bacterium]